MDKSTPRTISALVHILARDRLTIFAGAGVSRASGLPLAGELTASIFDLLPLKKTDKEALKAARLPFEGFIETFSQICDPSDLYKIYEQGVPNSNHHLCVHLCKRNVASAIVTTNFDLLFEAAFKSAGVEFESHWRNHELSTVNWKSRAPKIIKVHGSIADAKSLAITIRQVAGQRYLQDRINLISQVFGDIIGDLILVLGYSCSDRFDINPALQLISGKHSDTILVMHTEVFGNDARIEKLSSHPLAGPFTNFPGLLVECDTRVLIRKIYEQILQVAAPNDAPPDLRWQFSISKWFEKACHLYGDSFPYYAAGCLLKATSIPKRSNVYLKRASEISPPLFQLIKILQKLSDNLRDLGDLSGAKQKLRRVLRLARGESAVQDRARALLSWGVIKADEKKYQQAIRYYRKSERLSRKCRDLELEGICIGNAGIVLKNLGGTKRLQSALRKHERALEIAREYGDKRSEGRTLGNLGITHSILGQIPTAVEYYGKARTVAENLGDEYHTAVWLANEAEDCLKLDRVKSEALIADATRIFSKIGSVQWVKYCQRLLRRDI